MIDRNYSVRKKPGTHNKAIGTVVFLLVIVSLGIMAILVFPKLFLTTNQIRKLDIIDLWEQEDFMAVYSITEKAITGKPDDPFFIFMNGLSAFYVGIAQITNDEINRYISESIFKLRKSILMFPKNNLYSRSCYIIGKAYYYKGNHYYDLAIKFLNKAVSNGFYSNDLYEYIGLAYAGIGDYHNSIISFSKILGENPSDLLLLSISKSYIDNDEPNQAIPYLFQCIDKSNDINNTIHAKLLLAKAYYSQGDIDKSENEYLSIIEIDSENAEVHFYLGELYNKTGDLIRARSEWRKVLKINPTHSEARSRLNV